MWMQNLLKNGWHKISRSESNSELSAIKIVRFFGANRINIARLIPNEKVTARPNTLSSRFGLGVFPPHTDFAFENVPPRYIIMSAPRPRGTKTFIYNSRELFSAIGADQLNRCLFQVVGLKTIFYTKLIANHNDRIVFRYNHTIMYPINNEAKIADDYIRNKWTPTEIIDWEETKTIIIDNWVIFHSRDKCDFSNLSNALWRLSIWG